MPVATRIALIEQLFENEDEPIQIPLLRAGKHFTARRVQEGIWVSNLATYPILSMAAFREAISLLVENGVGVRVRKGDAMNCKLGDPGLPLDSIEGRIASQVYDKEIGQSVFRRITPIVCILLQAGVITDGPGYVTLNALPAN